MFDNIIVLGAGIAGISAAFHMKKYFPNSSIKIYEKSHDWGGMCGGFTLKTTEGDFWFDNAVHLSFAKDPYVQEIFHTSSHPIRHTPNPLNYKSGIWIKHPAQNNLYPLPVKEKVKILENMIKNSNSKIQITNFEEWLKAQYGDYFTQNFPALYTRKYWTLEAKELSTSWVGPRFYVPNFEEVLYGAMSEDTPNTYYAQEMRYPHQGKYRSFFESMRDTLDIELNHEVTSINPQEKTICFANQKEIQYNHLISTLPLPEIIKLIKNIPQEILQASQKLYATSVALVSLGFNKAEIAKNLWFYIYDEDKLFARVYSPSLKSPQNAPKNCSSLQAEIYFSHFKSLETMTGKTTTNDIASFCIEHVKNHFYEMGGGYAQKTI